MITVMTLIGNSQFPAHRIHITLVQVNKVIHQVKTNCGNVYGGVIICFNQGFVLDNVDDGFSRDEFAIYESEGKCFVV